MDHTPDEEDSHSDCDPQQPGTPGPLESSTTVIITRRRNSIQASSPTFSSLVENIRTICSSRGDESDGAGLSLGSIFSCHTQPVSQLHIGQPYNVIHRNLLLPSSRERYPSQPSQAIIDATASDDTLVRNENENEIDLMMHRYHESVLHMLRLLDSFLQGSHSLLISHGNHSLNFRLVSEEQSSRFHSESAPYENERQDRYRDMRLDVDNMSYEELLTLEDNIGNVNIGLPEELITESLRNSNYILFADENGQKECCTVCQEEYEEGDALGTLDCGHRFHNACIKQWLRCKNICPVCKTTGLCVVSSKLLQKSNL